MLHLTKLTSKGELKMKFTIFKIILFNGSKKKLCFPNENKLIENISLLLKNFGLTLCDSTIQRSLLYSIHFIWYSGFHDCQNFSELNLIVTSVLPLFTCTCIISIIFTPYFGFCSVGRDLLKSLCTLFSDNQ